MAQGYERFQNFQGMYLNSNDADVWFLIDGERIPCHMFFVRRMPYFEAMLTERWYRNNEIHFGAFNSQGVVPADYDHSISAKSFKEFLKYIYGHRRNLTMENIRGVIDMANGTESRDLFTECEEFLQNSITKNNLRKLYRWANLYEMTNLKADIFAHVDRALKSKSFLQFSFEFLREILENDSSACEEKDLFDACIAWAKAACRRNHMSHTTENVRNQLNYTENGQTKNLLHQIRFTSMVSKDAAVACVKANPRLFRRDEIEEILCMVGHNESFHPKKFTWDLRRFHFNWDRGQLLHCSRLIHGDKSKTDHAVTEECQVTQFTCNKCIILKGFKLELSRGVSNRTRIQVNEVNSDGHSVECYPHDNLTAEFRGRTHAKYDSFVVDIALNENHILLRPNYTYEICITFLNPMVDLKSKATLKRKVRVDHDIVFNFERRGIVASLSFRRFDDRKLLPKLVHNPQFWLWIMVVLMILCIGTAIFMWPRPIFDYLYPKITTFARYALYTCIGAVLLCCCCLCSLAAGSDNSNNSDDNANRDAEIGQRLLQEINQHQYIDDEP